MTVKAAAIKKNLLGRSDFDTNWRLPVDPRQGTFIPWASRSKSPSPVRFNRLRSGALRRDRGTWRNPSQRYHKTYTFKLRAEEPTILRGLKTGKLYARFPEDTTVSADAQGQGEKGVTTFQTNKGVQVPESPAYLTSFGKSFGRMHL